MVMDDIACVAGYAFRVSDPRQERIFEKLGLIGPAPAASFRDACRLLETEHPLETSTHLVSHLLREIEGALREVLVPLSETRTTEASNPDADEEDSEERENESHRAQIRSALGVLEMSADDEVAALWIEMRREFSRRAHRWRLAAPRPVDDDFLDFWDRAQIVLASVLDRFSAHYLRSHDAIDRLVDVKTPTRGHAKTLRHRIPNNLVALSYFFDNLDDPAWLEVLRAEGFFRLPPTPELTSDGVRTPPWPASRYLARMAGHRPDLVRDIILEMPATKNDRVHEDLVSAAHSMPADVCLSLLSQIESWIEAPHQRKLLADQTAALATRLVHDGHPTAGLCLMRAVLRVSPATANPGSGEVYG